MRISPSPTDKDSFKHYATLVKKHNELRDNRITMMETISSVNSTLGDIAIKFPNSSSHPLVQALKEEVQTYAQKLEDLVKKTFTF